MMMTMVPHALPWMLMDLVDGESTCKAGGGRRAAYSSCLNGAKRTRRFQEEDDRYTFRLNAPGASAESTDVRVFDDGRVQLCVKTADNKTTLVERSFHLPKDADTDKVRAAVVNGVLQVHVPKVERQAPVTVPVSAEEEDVASADDKKEAYTIRKNVPGVAAKDVEVSIDEENVMRVEAKKYAYAFALPEDADAAKASARCALGVLTLRIPRVPAPAPLTVATSDTIPSDDERAVDLIRMSVPGFGATHASVEVKREISGACLVHVKLEKDGATRERYVSLPSTLQHHEHIRAALSNGVLVVWADAAAMHDPTGTAITVEAEPLAKASNNTNAPEEGA